MLPNFFPRASCAYPLRLLISASIVAALTACGGGGGSPGATTGGSGTPGGGSGTPGGGVIGQPAIQLTIVDGAGTAVSTLSGGQNAIIRARLLTSAGVAAPNEVVRFTSSDPLVVFDPVSASSLTDANGVAVINVKPASTTSAGAVTITATSVVAAVTTTATANIAVGAAPLTVGTLSFTPAPTAPLPAFSVITLNIPITSGGLPATDVAGLSMSSLCTGAGTAKLQPGSLTDGVMSATYTNEGCRLGTDTITVSIGNSSKTIQLQVGAANIGNIQFNGTDLAAGTSIVLKGSGGLDRKESAIVTFSVVDQNNRGLPGVDVNFRATTTTGGLKVAPLSGVTDAAGRVSTTVSSGTLPTPVRVIAEAQRNGQLISGLSDLLTISTGLPIQRSMSLSSDSYNIEGWTTDGQVANMTIRLADQFGNPISDGTAVNFVSEGGAVATSAQGACTTSNGSCSVELKSQEFRPRNGRVSVLVYVQGLENFIDTNGDGQYSCTNPRDALGATPLVYRPLVDTCVNGGEPFTDQGDPYLDAGTVGTLSGIPSVPHTFDDSMDTARLDRPIPFNRSVYSANGDGKWGLNYIWRQAEIVFSDMNTAMLERLYCTGDTCVPWNSATHGDAYLMKGLEGTGCTDQRLTFRLYDQHNNPLPKDTTVGAVDAQSVMPQTMTPNLVPSTAAVGGTIHSVIIRKDPLCLPGSFSVRTMSPLGRGKIFGPFASTP